MLKQITITESPFFITRNPETGEYTIRDYIILGIRHHSGDKEILFVLNPTLPNRFSFQVETGSCPQTYLWRIFDLLLYNPLYKYPIMEGRFIVRIHDSITIDLELASQRLPPKPNYDAPSFFAQSDTMPLFNIVLAHERFWQCPGYISDLTDKCRQLEKRRNYGYGLIQGCLDAFKNNHPWICRLQSVKNLIEQIEKVITPPTGSDA